MTGARLNRSQIHIANDAGDVQTQVPPGLCVNGDALTH
jgi:hypothetical protein